MVKITETIILAGGKGKRMRSVTMDKYPKHLALIQNKAILEWELNWLAREGMKHVVLALGHLSDKIKAYFSNEIDTDFGKIDISYSIERDKLGSGGAVKLASSLLTTNYTYLVNGDVLTNAPLNDMTELHMDTTSLATMFLVKMRSPYGVVETEGKMIAEFLEKPLLDVYIHGGIDVINTSIIDRFPEKGQMEETIFVDLVEEGRFAAHKVDDKYYWLSIDGEKDFEIANTEWPGL